MFSSTFLHKIYNFTKYFIIYDNMLHKINTSGGIYSKLDVRTSLFN